MKHALVSLVAALAAVSALAAQSPIVSTFAAGLVITNPGPPAATQYFDVNVTNPAGITVSRFEVNVNTTAGSTGTFSVWVTAPGGTHFGNQQLAAAWTQVATASLSFTGGRTSVPLPTPFHLPPGVYGMALHHVSFNPVYTNPTVPVPPLLPTYANADVTLDMTTARVRTSLTTDPFGGTATGNTPRHPNLAMHYTVGPVAVDFAATPTRGASPLAVQFTSMATSANPGGILAYAWDFNGDNVTDSTAQHPTLFACGNFTVSLTSSAVGPTTVTKNNVQTDIVVPGFTTSWSRRTRSSSSTRRRRRRPAGPGTSTATA
jgi:PKD repeat protein